MDESQLPPEEAERRRRQRELRQMALTMRSQGKEYNPKKERKRLAKFAASAEGAVADGHKPRHARLQVIIVPIFWNAREAEKATVLDAASIAQKALRAAGVRCDTDTSHKLAPGQKFRHWEERGVKVRVEVGPQEAEAGACVLALCKEPGAVADKRRVKLGPPLVEAVGAALGVMLHAAPAVPAVPAAPKAEAGGGGTADEKRGEKVNCTAGASKGEKKSEKSKRKKEKGGVGGDDGSAALPGGAEMAEVEVPGGKVRAVGVGPSGDDLDGDFDEAVLLGDEGGKEGMGKKKKGKKKARQDSDGEGEGLEGWPPADEEQGGRKGKKSKVVNFL